MYNFHYTIKDTNGQIIEQDRQTWYFEDFLADILDQNYGTPFAYEILSVERKDLRNGEVVKIDTAEGLKDIYERTIDELEFRRREVEEPISDLRVAIKDLN